MIPWLEACCHAYRNIKCRILQALLEQQDFIGIQPSIQTAALHGPYQSPDSTYAQDLISWISVLLLPQFICISLCFGLFDEGNIWAIAVYYPVEKLANIKVHCAQFVKMLKYSSLRMLLFHKVRQTRRNASKCCSQPSSSSSLFSSFKSNHLTCNLSHWLASPLCNLPLLYFDWLGSWSAGVVHTLTLSSWGWYFAIVSIYIAWT